jgi:hypothetical protein
MAIPSEKSPEMENAITKAFKIDRRGSIQNNTCTWCGGQATEFRDPLSRKEFTISGFCQKCQDETFGE